MSAETLDTAPSINRDRSYSGDYMSLGKRGEEVVIEWLKNRPEVISHDDLRELRPMQKADVDFAIYSVDGRVALLEVKTCRHLGKSGNVLFEVLRINHTCDPVHSLGLGWSGRSPATYIAYYAISVEQIWIASFNDFRKCFQEYTCKARKNIRFDVVPTDRIKTTVNILIPEAEIKCFKKYNLSLQPTPF